MKVGLWPNHTDLRKIVIDHPTRPTESLLGFVTKGSESSLTQLQFNVCWSWGDYFPNILSQRVKRRLMAEGSPTLKHLLAKLKVDFQAARTYDHWTTLMYIAPSNKLGDRLFW